MKISALVLVLLAIGCPGQDALQRQVNAAISKGQASLLRTLDAARNGQRISHGSRGLAVLALLKCGVDPQESPMDWAVESLLQRASSTYEVAIRLLVQEQLNDPRFDDTARADLRTLLETQFPSGGWRYGSGGGQADNSCTQYALLGLHAARNLGLSVPKQCWTKASAYLRRQIMSAGGAGYEGPKNPSPSMTSGVLSSLLIVQKHQETEQRLVSRAIERNERWLERHWKPGERQSWQYYTLYGIERAMGFANHPKLGERDWYVEGAQWLIVQQDAETGAFGAGSDQTAFALLFLIRKSSLSSAGRTTVTPLYQIMERLGEQTTDQEVRATATSLAKRGRNTCEFLVPYLQDPVRSRRAAAVFALRELTQNDLGFDPAASIEINKAAIERWALYVSPIPSSGR